MRSVFNLSCGKGQGVFVASPLQEVHITYTMWVGLNGFDHSNYLDLSGIRIGMDCMNLVTAISKYTQVPITLRSTLSTRP